MKWKNRSKEKKQKKIEKQEYKNRIKEMKKRKQIQKETNGYRRDSLLS